MKHFFLIILFLIAINSTSSAQNPVMDRYPGAQIYVIDPQSGQETPVTTDLAILFKDALINLVRNTYSANVALSGQRFAKHRFFTITQMGAETNVNGYQVVLEQQLPDRNIN